MTNYDLIPVPIILLFLRWHLQMEFFHKDFKSIKCDTFFSRKSSSKYKQGLTNKYINIK